MAQDNYRGGIKNSIRWFQCMLINCLLRLDLHFHHLRSRYEKSFEQNVASSLGVKLCYQSNEGANKLMVVHVMKKLFCPCCRSMKELQHSHHPKSIYTHTATTQKMSNKVSCYQIRSQYIVRCRRVFNNLD